MAKKTTREKVEALREKSAAHGKKISEQIKALQDACPHTSVKCDRRVVGYNGYGNDYTTYCTCELCLQSWIHDGYCVGYTHARKVEA